MWLGALLLIVLVVIYLDGRRESKRERKKARRRERRSRYLPNPWYIEFLLRFKKAKRSEDSYTGHFVEYKHLLGYTYIVNEGFAPRKEKK